MRRVVALVAAGVMLASGAGTVTEPARASGNAVSGVGAAGVMLAGPATAQTLRPPACAALTLSSLRTGSGLVFGTTSADLILGSAGGDAIFALAGDDCVVAGSGADLISGGAGTDLCDGGPDADTFSSCEATAN